MLAIFMVEVIARDALVWYTAGALLWPDQAPRNLLTHGFTHGFRRGRTTRPSQA